MIRHTDAGLRRWQDEVARDPGSPAFVPLADLYRVQGRLDVARRVCVRGLERHPNHVEAHYLLGRIYRDGDEAEKAYDEWDIALSLDPLHSASRRAIAFLCLERGEMREAERHLRKALTNDPDDPRVRRALRFIERGADTKHRGSDYWEAVARLAQPATASFARAAQVRLALVIDASGRLLTQHGFSPDLDLAGVASLAAGVQAASGEIARMLGQPRFSQLYQGRGDNQIFLGAIDSPAGELLLLAVFGEETNIGLVRMLYRDLVRRIEAGPWPATATPAAAENLEAELAESLSRAGRSVDPFAFDRDR
jgi:predicted regulator of Ras-like GTPase activity (Roadblock/LC7/MglB family)